MSNSILSTGEEAIAARLGDGETPEEIAAATDREVEAVEKAADRIRAKTDRALATLAESPYTAEAVATCSEAQLDALRSALEAGSSKQAENSQ